MSMAGKKLQIAVCALLLFACVANAQDGGPPQKAKPYMPRKIVLSPEPVTRDEAKKVIDQVDAALVNVMPSVKKTASSLSGSQPVTRAEVVSEFHRIFDAAKPEFKFTPRKISYDSSLLTLKDASAKTKLQSLIAWGCVDRVGPLATSGKDTLGVLEFGDAVGFLLARVAQLSHMPDPRFTPDLEP